VRETHNPWITVDLCEQLGLLSYSLLSKLRWGHFELGFDARKLK